MKIFSAALVALLGLAEAKNTISNSEISNRLRDGKINRKLLMEKAIPYGHSRKLEQGAFEISGKHSIQFSTCIDLTVKDKDLLSEDLVSYTKSGQLVAEKSYILFEVCETDNCYYQAHDSKSTFLVDAPTFVQALATYIPTQYENYCQGCRENEDYCYGNYGNQDQENAADEAGNNEEQDAQEAENNQEDKNEQEAQDQNQNGGRLLAVQEVEMIDCKKCTQLNCYEENNQDDQYNIDYEGALEWLVGCNQIENEAWNNYNLYSGLICNQAGTGIEIGVFMDENCLVYLPEKSFSSIMSAEDKAYVNKTTELVEYMFTNPTDCYYEEIKYTNPYDYQNDGNANEQAQNDDKAYQAGDWCAQLFDGQFQAVDLYDCGGQQNDNNNNNQAQQNDDAVANSEWYKYELTQNDMEDEYAVCTIVQKLEGEYKKSHVYVTSQSGTTFHYEKTTQKKGLSGGSVAAIVIICVLVAAGGAAWAFQGKRKSMDKKKQPLINGLNAGTMA